LLKRERIKHRVYGKWYEARNYVFDYIDVLQPQAATSFRREAVAGRGGSEVTL